MTLLSLLSVPIFAALSLGVMPGNNAKPEAERGYSVSFVGIPYSCTYDLPPATITSTNGTRAIGFEKPLGTDAIGEGIRSNTPSFVVSPTDQLLTLNLAYKVQSTPSADPLAAQAMRDFKSTGHSLVWWIHRVVLIDAVTGKDLELVSDERFEAGSTLPPSLPSSNQSRTIDLGRYTGRSVQLKYISTGFTFTYSKESRMRVVVQEVGAPNPILIR